MSKKELKNIIIGTAERRAEIVSDQVEAFLRKGGEIKQIDIGKSGQKNEGPMQIVLSKKKRDIN
tara:strand:- start:315 stop:506 length:192 start_codon:yes stop_codon:yes gene_type:complete